METSVKEILLNGDNKDCIVINGEDGKSYTFEQVAVLYYDERLYCILKPKDKIPGINENEGVVFYCKEDNELLLETNEEILNIIFDEYCELLKDNGGVNL